MSAADGRFGALLRSVLGTRSRRNFARVAGANVIAQVALVAATPLLTRLYEPAAFGVLGLYLASSQILFSFATGRFDMLLPNQQNGRRALATCGAGALCLVATCSLAIVAVVFDDALLDWWPGRETLGPWLWLLPLTTALNGLQQLARGWWTRDGDLGPVAVARLVQSWTYIGAALALAVVIAGGGGLVLATAASFAAGAGAHVVAARARARSAPQRTIALPGVAEAWRAAREQRRPAATATAVAVVNVVGFALPVLMLGRAYGAAEIGLYVLLQRLLAAPIGALTQALSMSFWSRAAELARRDDFTKLRREYLRLTGTLAAVAALLVVATLLCTPLIEPVLGPDWAGAATLLPALLPLVVGMVVFSAPNHMIVLGRQELQMVGDGVRLVGSLGVGLAAPYLGLELVATVWLFSGVSLVAHALVFALHLWLYARGVPVRAVSGLAASAPGRRS